MRRTCKRGRQPQTLVTRVVLILWTAVAIVSGSAGYAAACQVCFSGRVVTIGQQLDAADQAVIGSPQPGGGVRVLAVVKGGLSTDSVISEPVSLAVAAVFSEGKPVLLLHNRLGQQWTNVGSIGAEHAGWLRSLAATYRSEGARRRAAWPKAANDSELTDEEWRQRVAAAVPYLENPDTLAAEIAVGEISRAPYPALRSLRSRLAVSAIAQWVDDPRLAGRRPVYWLLLGIAGGPEERARLQSRIDAKRQARDATEVAAMLTAELELYGPDRVEWVEKVYLADRSRTLPEIEAALLALSVHGGADTAVPRARVIAAYRLFMQERKPMAGFVAQDLADWEYWDATADYVSILKSDVVKDPASHFMIVNYLHRSPRTSASANLLPSSPTK